MYFLRETLRRNSLGVHGRGRRGSSQVVLNFFFRRRWAGDREEEVSSRGDLCCGQSVGQVESLEGANQHLVAVVGRSNTEPSRATAGYEYVFDSAAQVPAGRGSLRMREDSYYNGNAICDATCAQQQRELAVQ